MTKKVETIFNDVESEPIYIKSHDNSTQISCNMSSKSNQTSMISNNINEYTQTEFKSTKGIQMDSYHKMLEDIYYGHKTDEKEHEPLSLNTLSSNYILKLNGFMNRIHPVMIKELNETFKIDKRGIFNNYTVNWDDESNEMTLKCTMKYKSLSSLYDQSTQNLFDTLVPNKGNDGRNDVSNDKDGEYLGCTCMDWNPDGKRIAVGYGSMKHNAWCLHSTHLIIWNIPQYIRQKTVINDDNGIKPEIIIEIESCCQCIKYHPKLNDILCVGLYNGCIKLYKIDRNLELNYIEIGKSNIDDYFHSQRITCIDFVKKYHKINDNNNLSIYNYYLVSTSLDGKILIWDINNKLLYPNIGYNLIPTKIYHGYGLYNDINTNSNIYNLCITNISFPNNIYGNFIVSTKGGGIINCIDNEYNIISNKNIKDGNIYYTPNVGLFLKRINSTQNEFELKKLIQKYARINKVHTIDMKILYNIICQSNISHFKIYPYVNTQMSYNNHIGYINTIQFNPHNRNIFLSCGNDGYLKIFSIFSCKPIIIIQPNYSNNINIKIIDAKWSNSRPLIICCIDNNGYLFIYDLYIDKHIPIIKIKINDNNTSLNSINFNNNGNNIGIINNNGDTIIYSLPNNIIKSHINEHKLIKKWVINTTK